MAVEEDLRQLVSYAAENNLNRLLLLILTMNSTVRHFKAANKLFIEVLRQKKLKGLVAMNRSFSLGQGVEEIGQKESDLERFLSNMLMYTEKHYGRMEKYVRGSYWL